MKCIIILLLTVSRKLADILLLGSYINKDENLHRYTVGGGKDRKRERDRDRKRERERDRDRKRGKRVCVREI